jgi:hypothetical protein
MYEDILPEDFTFAEEHMSDALAASKTQFLASVHASEVEGPSLVSRAQAELGRLKLPEFRHAAQVVEAAVALANRVSELDRVRGKLIIGLSDAVMAFDPAMVGLKVDAMQKSFDVFKQPQNTDPMKQLRSIVDATDSFPAAMKPLREAAVTFGTAMVTAYLDTSVALDARLEDLRFYLKDVNEIESSVEQDREGRLINEVI